MKRILQTQALLKKRCFSWFAIVVTLSLFAAASQDVLAQSYDLSPGNTWILDDGIFEPGTASIAAPAKERLERLGSYLTDRPDLKIQVEGYWEKGSSEATAKRNSQARADAVKDYLSKKFSIDAGRIIAVGYGSSFPIESENTKEGVAASRRVEVVGLTPITKQPLTRSSRAGNAVAYISLIEGDLQTKAPWDDDFVGARYQQQLFEGHKINVYLHGRSAITFLNGGKIEVLENSRLTLYGETGADNVPNLVLDRGTLRLDLRPLSGNSEFKINVPGGVVTFYNGNAKMTVAKENDQQKFELCLFEGAATVAVNGGIADVKPGYGLRIVGSESPLAVKPLPASPDLILPLNNQTVSVGKTTFSWKTDVPNSELQFSKEPDFRTFVSRNPVSSASQLTMALDPGVYFWRVLPVDAYGMEGQPSEMRRIIATSDVLTPSMMKEKVTSVLKGEPKAKLILTCATDTTVEDNSYEITGKVDLGSKVFINSWPIESPVQTDVFSKRVNLFKGDNNFRVSVYALNSFENSQFVNVRYLPKQKFRFGISLMPIIPVTLKKYKFGLGAQLNGIYKVSDRFSLKAGIGGAGIGVDPEAFGTAGQGQDATISSIFIVDFGVSYDLLSDAKVVPYVEGGVGYTSWYASSALTLPSHNADIFSPGLGLGLRVDYEERSIGLGGYYRFLFDKKKELDQSNLKNIHGVTEIRLTFWF